MHSEDDSHKDLQRCPFPCPTSRLDAWSGKFLPKVGPVSFVKQAFSCQNRYTADGSNGTSAG